MHIKTMVLTISGTSIIIFLSAWLFLNGLLASFGLAATSLHTLKNLHTSQNIVNQMKQRHQVKNTAWPPLLLNARLEKIASTTLAAATIGTVSVAITMVSLEVSDYCEQKNHCTKMKIFCTRPTRHLILTNALTTARNDLWDSTQHWLTH